MIYLQINPNVASKGRPAAATIYSQFKGSFLSQTTGAISKELLIRDEDVQALRGFESVENAKGYLTSSMFCQDVVTALGPLPQSSPDARIYSAA